METTLGLTQATLRWKQHWGAKVVHLNAFSICIHVKSSLKHHVLNTRATTQIWGRQKPKYIFGLNMALVFFSGNWYEGFIPLWWRKFTKRSLMFSSYASNTSIHNFCHNDKPQVNPSAGESQHLASLQLKFYHRLPLLPFLPVLSQLMSREQWLIHWWMVQTTMETLCSRNCHSFPKPLCQICFHLRKFLLRNEEWSDWWIEICPGVSEFGVKLPSVDWLWQLLSLLSLRSRRKHSCHAK